LAAVFPAAAILLEALFEDVVARFAVILEDARERSFMRSFTCDRLGVERYQPISYAQVPVPAAGLTGTVSTTPATGARISSTTSP